MAGDFLECFPSLNYRSQPRSQNAIMGLYVCFAILKFLNLQWPCFVTCVSGYNIQQKFWLFLSVVAYLSTQELGDWEFKAAWAIAQVPGVRISTKAERGRGGGGSIFVFKKDAFILILCVWIFCLHVYLCIMWMQILWPRRGSQMSWPWSYRWLWVTVWVLGIKPRCSERAAGALRPWASFTTPKSWKYQCFFY